MSHPIELLSVVLKVAFVAAFAMGLGVLLTWADRRQGAMIQDRVGPNRAVVFLPGRLVAAMASLSALATIAGIFYLAFLFSDTPEWRTPVAAIFTHAAILLWWVMGVSIAGRTRVRGPRGKVDRALASLGDPRRIVYAGLSAHAVALACALGLRGTEIGVTLREIGYRSGAALAAAAVLAGASYYVFRVKDKDRVGFRLAGLLHPVADGIKSIFKEDIVPSSVDRLMHALSPLISFFPTMVVMAVVPFGPGLCFDESRAYFGLFDPATSACAGQSVLLQVLDIDTGILFYFALGGTGIIGAALAGWASNSKYALLGSLRAASQMVSYEVTMGLTLIGALMIYGTLRLEDMVAWQGSHAWGLFVQPLAFILFFVAAVAEGKRIPFDLPEGESEIVAGYFTEYSGMKFAMFFFSEYITIVTSCALMTTVFLGGWDVPFLDPDGLRVVVGDRTWLSVPLPHILVVLLGIFAFCLKTLGLCWLHLTVRWTLPRFRYDQLMHLGWKRLLPISLGNILVTAVVALALDGLGEQGSVVLAFLGDVTRLVVVGAATVAGVGIVRGLLKPATHHRLIVTSSARIVEAWGRTPVRTMGA
jgi:NADH-quinone oxidoreductase subunit H